MMSSQFLFHVAQRHAKRDGCSSRHHDSGAASRGHAFSRHAFIAERLSPAEHSSRLAAADGGRTPIAALGGEARARDAALLGGAGEAGGLGGTLQEADDFSAAIEFHRPSTAHDGMQEVDIRCGQRPSHHWRCRIF